MTVRLAYDISLVRCTQTREVSCFGGTVERSAWLRSNAIIRYFICIERCKIRAFVALLAMSVVAFS